MQSKPMQTLARPRRLLGLCLAAALGSPAAAPTRAQDQAAPPGEPALVGADRDPHGCIGSAGYSWCERTQQCERPWELAAAKGFANTPEAFAKFCASSRQ